jgi:hypothetical protein
MLLARRILHNVINVNEETLYYMFPSIDGDGSSFLAATGLPVPCPPSKPHLLWLQTFNMK